MAEKKNKYRNPANDIVDGGARGARRAASRVSRTAQRSASGISRAAARTAAKERAAQTQAMGYTARKKREAEKNKPAPKPAAKANWRDKVQHTDYATLRKGQNDAIRNHPGNNKQETAPALPLSPAVGAPIHAAPQAFARNSQVQNGTLSGTPPAGGSPYAPQANAQPKLNTPQASSYGADGKSLYNAGKGDNPLMRRTFGYQTGQHPGAQPTAPAAPAPQQPMAPQYQGNDEPGALGQAENPLAALGQLLNRKKISISLSN